MSWRSVSHRLVSRLPFPVTRWLAGQRLLLPYYHLVSDNPPAHVKHLYPCRSLAQFEAELDFFLTRYTPLGLPDLLACLDQDRPLPDRALFLSFDDGLRELAEVVAPLLQGKGVPATFFLIPDCLNNRALPWFCKKSLLLDAQDDEAVRKLRHDDDRQLDDLGRERGIDFAAYAVKVKPFLDAGQVRQLLAQGFTIGAHSVDHPVYRDLTLAEQIRQTTASVHALQERFGLNYRVFAFPHHDLGVTAHFFQHMFDNNLLDASFGTSGLREEPFPRHFQRLNMEAKWMPPRDRLHEEYADYLLPRA